MKGDAAVADDTTDASDTDESAPSNAELAARVDGLDSKLSLILDKLGGAEGKAHDAAQQRTEDRLDRPSTVAEEIRAQLAERDRQKAAADHDKADADWRAGVDARLEGMAEKTPEAPVRKVENWMGWRARA